MSLWTRLKELRAGPEPTSDPLRSEGAIRRGWRETPPACLSFPFVAVEFVGTALSAAEFGWFGGVVGFFALVGVVFVGSVLAAPFKQRNELRANLTAAEGTDEWLHAACRSLSDRIDRLLDEQEAKRPPTSNEFWAMSQQAEATWELATSNKCIRFKPDFKAILDAVQARGWIDEAESERLYHDEGYSREGWRRVARQLDEWAGRVAPGSL